LPADSAGTSYFFTSKKSLLEMIARASIPYSPSATAAAIATISAQIAA